MNKPEIPEIEAAEKPASGEARLWLAVVWQAVYDATQASDTHFLDTAVKRGARFDPELARGEARRWCTSDLDPWASAREEVCAMAGLDPDAIKAMVGRRIAALRAAGDDERRVEVARSRIKAGMDARLERLLAGFRDGDTLCELRLRKLAELEADAF